MSLLEALADLEHDRWARWQRYLHGKCTRGDDGSLTIPAGYVVNLERQISTPYAKLTENEKESDRKEARNTIGVLSELLEQVINALIVESCGHTPWEPACIQCAHEEHLVTELNTLLWTVRTAVASTR